MLQCDLCQRTFFTNSGLRHHNCSIQEKARGQEVVTLVNKPCSDRHVTITVIPSNSSDKTQNDEIGHTREEKPKRHKCSVCDCLFMTRKLLRLHIANVHDNAKQLKCQICDKIYGRNGNLLRHISNKHENDRQFKCHICNGVFTQRCDLNKHIFDVHEKTTRFQCQTCDRLFTRRDHLTRHNSKVHEQRKKLHADCQA